ncbi:T9SS type A sorting domain-containing protein, partial [candidate division KSB1 bacterium]|nr:T9SS type A sorting domain-containing protein [candidate division KSB1 bacterium]
LFVRSIAINSSGHIFAGTNGGVFRSTDNGGSWAPVNVGLTNLQVRSLAINSSRHIFAGTYGGGVFRSMDNGGSWAPVNLGLTNLFVRSIAIDSSGYIFAGTDGGGVFRSTDNGGIWAPVNVGLTNLEVRSLAINSSRHIFAGTGRGVFRSTDNGVSWAPVNVGLTNLIRIVWSLAINSSGHIFAGTNGGGIFRSLQSTLVPTITTNAATNVGTTSATLNGIVNPNSLSTTVKFQYGTTTNYGNEIAASPSPVAGTTAVAVSANLTNLAPDTLYHFRLVVTNNVGTTEGEDQTFNTLACGSLVIVHTPPDSQEAGKELKIAADISTDCGVASAILKYRRGGDINFTTVPAPDPGSSYQWTIPTIAVTSRGMEYVMVVTNVGGGTVQMPSSGVFSLPVHVPKGLVKEEAQPTGSDRTAYRLISVPLKLKDKSPQQVLADDLGNYKRSAWRFYELRADYLSLPSNTSIYAEFPDISELQAGRAYWLIVKEPGKRISTGTGTSIRTDSVFTYPLHPGWNFVGNPFHFDIPFSKTFLQKAKKIPEFRYREEMWKSIASDSSGAMKPFEGYAVYVDSADILQINPDLTEVPSTVSKCLYSENIHWSIRILAQCQEARDEDNLAAIISAASDHRDEFDQPEPPVIGEYVCVYFPHREWNTLAKTYCLDARPEPTEGEVWEFEVKTNIHDKVKLTFEGVGEVPKELEVWLVDDALKITQNLREQGQYAVAGAGADHPKQLKLVVGKRSFVDEKLAKARAIPTTYELSQNFPNPFNPATTIRYGLPKAERVTLKIYNLLGEEVALIINDELRAAGYHAAIWDGRDKNGSVVTSGVYVYRMQAGNFAMTKKLALVK